MVDNVLVVVEPRAQVEMTQAAKCRFDSRIVAQSTGIPLKIQDGLQIGYCPEMMHLSEGKEPVSPLMVKQRLETGSNQASKATVAYLKGQYVVGNPGFHPLRRLVTMVSGVEPGVLSTY